MVRLESYKSFMFNTQFMTFKFTFQYGQIRKLQKLYVQYAVYDIYIPVWLDQKDEAVEEMAYILSNLHSSMVRLESYEFEGEVLKN